MIVELNELTIRALFERSAQKFGNLPAIAFVGEKPKTYSEVFAEAQKTASSLVSREIKKGDKVTILGDNSPNWVIAYLAVTTLGAVAVPILPGFHENDIRHIIRHSESVAVFVSQKYRSKLEGIDSKHLRTIYSLEDLSAEKDKKEKKGNPDPAKFPKPNPEDLAVIIYTSGTTGNSKGVMLTHHNITSDVVNSIEKFPIDHNDRFLSILPLAHTFEATGGMLCPMAVGVSIYYMQGLPTPQKLLASMAEVRPTGVLTVPLVMDKIYRKRILPQLEAKKPVWALYQTPFFRKVLNQVAGKKLIKSLGGSLRFFMFGGAALNRDVEVFLRDAKISYSTGYGMTETSPIMTINPFGKVRVQSCGQPIPGIEIKIHEPDPKTGIGEIVVKGPMVMQGYFKNPEATRETFLKDGWLRTGDLGYFDKDNYLYIKGRSKNVIVGPSGENIYPEIVEAQILQNPLIQQTIVYELQGRIVAKVYLDPDMLDQELKGKQINESETASFKNTLLESIRQEVNQQLPTFSTISKFIEHPEPFDMTPTNKVKRYLYIS